jgi:hypothetical protein
VGIASPLNGETLPIEGGVQDRYISVNMPVGRCSFDLNYNFLWSRTVLRAKGVIKLQDKYFEPFKIVPMGPRWGLNKNAM